MYFDLIYGKKWKITFVLYSIKWNSALFKKHFWPIYSLTLLFKKAKHFPMLEIFISSVFLTFMKKNIQKEKFKCN